MNQIGERWGALAHLIVNPQKSLILQSERPHFQHSNVTVFIKFEEKLSKHESNKKLSVEIPYIHRREFNENLLKLIPIFFGSI